MLNEKSLPDGIPPLKRIRLSYKVRRSRGRVARVAACPACPDALCRAVFAGRQFPAGMGEEEIRIVEDKTYE